MCSDLRYVGLRPEDAAIFKLMGNAMILAVVGGLNDMFRIAEQQGLPRDRAYALFDFYDPSGQVKGRGKRMASEQYEALWTVDMAHKDAALMQGAAHHERLPVIDAMKGSYETSRIADSACSISEQSHNANAAAAETEVRYAAATASPSRSDAASTAPAA